MDGQSTIIYYSNIVLCDEHTAVHWLIGRKQLTVYDSSRTHLNWINRCWFIHRRDLRTFSVDFSADSLFCEILWNSIFPTETIAFRTPYKVKYIKFFFKSIFFLLATISRYLISTLFAVFPLPISRSFSPNYFRFRYQQSCAVRSARVLCLRPTHQRRKSTDTCSERFRARFVAMKIIKVQAGACAPEMRDKYRKA